MVTCFLTSSSRSILKTLNTQQKASFSRDVEDFSSSMILCENVQIHKGLSQMAAPGMLT